MKKDEFYGSEVYVTEHSNAPELFFAEAELKYPIGSAAYAKANEIALAAERRLAQSDE